MTPAGANCFTAVSLYWNMFIIPSQEPVCGICMQAQAPTVHEVMKLWRAWCAVTATCCAMHRFAQISRVPAAAAVAAPHLQPPACCLVPAAQLLMKTGRPAWRKWSSWPNRLAGTASLEILYWRFCYVIISSIKLVAPRLAILFNLSVCWCQACAISGMWQGRFVF